jgi:hypothetical protein
VYRRCASGVHGWSSHVCVTVSGRQRAVCQHTLPSGHTKSPLVHAPAIASHTVRGNNGWPLRWRGHGAPSPRLMGAATTSASRCARQWAAVATAHRHRSSPPLILPPGSPPPAPPPPLIAIARRRHRSSPPLVTTARRLRSSSPPLLATTHRQRSSPALIACSPPLVASVRRHRCQTAARRHCSSSILNACVHSHSHTHSQRCTHRYAHTHTHAHARAREYTHATLSTKQSTSAQRSDRMTRLAVCSVYSSS